jgi:hypothetical protein
VEERRQRVPLFSLLWTDNAHILKRPVAPWIAEQIGLVLCLKPSRDPADRREDSPCNRQSAAISRQSRVFVGRHRVVIHRIFARPAFDTMPR